MTVPGMHTPLGQGLIGKEEYHLFYECSKTVSCHRIDFNVF